MGLTAEHVANRFNVSRGDQDAFAATSHQRAIAAIQAGRFKDEIVPVSTRVHAGTWRDIVMDTDEGLRLGSTADVRVNCGLSLPRVEVSLQAIRLKCRMGLQPR